MILGCQQFADYHCWLQNLEVPVCSGNRWHHSACTFTANSCSKLRKLKTRDWCKLRSVCSETTGTFGVDLRGASPTDNCDKEEFSKNNCSFCTGGTEGLVLHIDLPYSPCKDSAELAYYRTCEKPVESWSRLPSRGDISTDTVPVRVGVDCLDSNLYEIVSHHDFCQENPVKPKFENSLEISLGELTCNIVLDANPECLSEVQEMLETVPSLEMPTPSVKDGLIEQVLARGEKEELSGPGLPRNSHEQLKMSSQGGISSLTLEPSETKMSKMGNCSLRAMLESDNVVQKMRSLGRDELVEAKLIRGEAEVWAEPELSRNLHEEVKHRDLCEFSSTSEVMVTHLARPLWEGNVQHLKRRQSSVNHSPELAPSRGETDGLGGPELTRALELNGPSQENLSCVTLENSHTQTLSNFRAQPMMPVKRRLPSGPDSLVEGVLVEAEKDGFAGLELPTDSPEELVSESQKELYQTGTLQDSETKMPLSLEFHKAVAVLEADNMQNCKRRRLESVGDVPLDRDTQVTSDENSAVHTAQEPNVLSISKESEDLKGSCCPGPILRNVAQITHEQDAGVKDLTGSEDYISKKSTSEVIKGKNDSHRDSSSSGRSEGNSVHDTLDNIHPGGPRRKAWLANLDIGSVETGLEHDRRKEWLAQHHRGNGETGIENDKEFAGNVGGSYRSAIDERPAAPHPGFVGDGATVQYCRVCRGREDSTSSLICDSCEEVFHMSCVNSRMKIIPRVDEWLCRPCRKKRKMSRQCDNQGDSDPGGESKDWWREDSGIGKIDRELLRMSNGRRMKVRMGPKYQAEVPDWTGIVDELDQVNSLTETVGLFGNEVSLTSEERQWELDQALFNLANNIWPKGWLPSTKLPKGTKENWLQCTLVLFDEGEICPDGRKAEKDIVCGKWRRAPVNMESNDSWECSCALVWDPRHADCAVPQELSTKEINERMKASQMYVQQEPAL